MLVQPWWQALARTCSIGAHDGVPSGFRSGRLFHYRAADSNRSILESQPTSPIANLLAASELRSIMVLPLGAV